MEILHKSNFKFLVKIAISPKAELSSNCFLSGLNEFLVTHLSKFEYILTIRKLEFE